MGFKLCQAFFPLGKVVDVGGYTPGGDVFLERDTSRVNLFNSRPGFKGGFKSTQAWVLILKKFFNN